VQAPSKNAISKTRTPVNAACLITDAKPMCGSSLMQTEPQRGRSQIALTISTMGDPIQKCPELMPESPPGAYDGRPKCAAVDVWCSPVSSLTTPSSGEEAQAESSHATTNTRIPHHAACLFTKPNLLIAEHHATRGIRAFMPNKGAAKKFCAERKARV
jgi:hypothetical protein